MNYLIITNTALASSIHSSPIDSTEAISRRRQRFAFVAWILNLYCAVRNDNKS